MDAIAIGNIPHGTLIGFAMTVHAQDTRTSEGKDFSDA